MKKISTNKSFYILLLINLLIVNYWMINSKAFSVHDFTTGARVFELTNAIKDGHFPPRWSQNFGFSLGMPLFQFYAPLAFYIASIFNLFSLSVLLSIKMVYLISTLIGFIGAYLLGKKLINHHGGLITATAFTLAPYHALNIYVRGATAEYVALSFTPLSIYFAFNLIDDQKQKVSYLELVLSLTAVYLSHNVTILTFMPFWFLLVFVYSILKSSFKRILITLFAQVHSFLISAYFLIPAFLQKSQTRAETLTEGFSRFNFHFLYFRQLFTPNWGYGGSVLGLDDDMSFYLGVDLLLLTAFSTIFILIKVKKKLSLLLMLLLTFFLSAFITNFKSTFLWNIVPLSRYIQFPWRFLGVSSLLISVLAGFSMLNKTLKKNWAIILSIIIVLNGRFFRPNKLIDPGETYNPNPIYIQEKMSGILPDYLPTGVNWENQEVPQSTVETLSAITKRNLPVKFKTISATDTKISIIQNSTDFLYAKIIATKPDSIIINRYYFPNWVVSINDQTDSCQKTKDSKYVCKINPGESELRVVWSEAGINFYSNMISIFGIIVLIILTKFL